MNLLLLLNVILYIMDNDEILMILFDKEMASHGGSVGLRNILERG